jgi:hypothetical protein
MRVVVMVVEEEELQAKNLAGRSDTDGFHICCFYGMVIYIL